METNCYGKLPHCISDIGVARTTASPTLDNRIAARRKGSFVENSAKRKTKPPSHKQKKKIIDNTLILMPHTAAFIVLAH